MRPGPPAGGDGGVLFPRGKRTKSSLKETSFLKNPSNYGGYYETLRTSVLDCSAWLDGPPGLFGFSGAQLRELFLRGSVVVGDLLRLNQPSYRRSFFYSLTRGLRPLGGSGPAGIADSPNQQFAP